MTSTTVDIICYSLTSPKKAWNDWQDNQVLTSVSTTALPISEIEFPAITICGQGSISEVRFRKYRTLEQLT